MKKRKKSSSLGERIIKIISLLIKKAIRKSGFFLLLSLLLPKISEDTKSDPRYCADWIKEIIHNQCNTLNLDAPELMSGPFHDALALSYVCDYGMIFVRCKDGISHNPLEYSSYEDLAIGANVMLGTVLEILKK